MIMDRGRLLESAVMSIKFSNTMMLNRRSTSQALGVLRGK